MAESCGAKLDAPRNRVIETERLRLRTLRLSDAEALVDILRREEVMRWTPQDPVTDIDQAIRWTSARALGPGVFNFLVELKAGFTPSQVVGALGSYHPPAVGYLFHPGIAYKDDLEC